MATSQLLEAAPRHLLPLLLLAFLAALNLAIWAGAFWYLPALGFLFASLAAITALARTQLIAPAVDVLNRLASLLAERGAFRSNPAAEAPKFALIRFLFGVFMLERGLWILLELQPSDWDRPIIWMIAVFNVVAAFSVASGFLTQISLGYLIVFQWQIGDAVLKTTTLGNDIAAMLAFLLLFANAGAHFSVDAALMKRGGAVGRLIGLAYYRHGMPPANTLQIAKFLTLLAYWCVCVYSLMMHLNEPAWMSGTAGPLLLTNGFMSQYAAEFRWFFELGPWAVWMGKLALWLMLPWYLAVLPFVLLGGIWRRYVIWWGVLFFALSLFVLQLGWLAHFEFLLFAGLFWQSAFMRREGGLQVAYDDRCNLCDRTVTFIKAADIFGRVDLRPLSQNAAWLRSHGIDPAEAAVDLYGIEPGPAGARTSSGYDFYIALSRSLLLLLPAYPFLLAGKWTAVGPLVYRFIADRRTRLFGVCQIPTRKPEHRLAPAGSASGIASSDLIVPVSLQVAILAAIYLLATPAPFAGWRGVAFPAAAVDAAHIYGIAPINVFNHTDLKLAETWFTLTAVTEGGAMLLPVLSEEGERLSMLKSDRIYFGHTLRFRRTTIGRHDCAFEDYRPTVEYLAERFRATANTIRYQQYFRPLPDLSGGSFQVGEAKGVCSVEF